MRSFLLFSVLSLVMLTHALSAESTLSSSLTPEDLNARSHVEAMEKTIATIHALPPDRRIKEEEQLLSKIERLERKVSGSGFHNKALFWLANWHLNHGTAADGLPMITSIEQGKSLLLKNAAQLTKTRILLKQGNLREARQIAESITAELPEFAIALQLVEFYELIGSPAPKTGGQNILGGPADPASSYSEPWILYAFINSESSMDTHLLSNYLHEYKKDAYQNILRIACVSFNANPLTATATIRQLEKEHEIKTDLLWANPAQNGDGDEWIRLWKLPKIPSFILLGPNRSIMAIDPSINDLRPLAGLTAETKKSRKKSKVIRTKKKGRMRWR